MPRRLLDLATRYSDVAYQALEESRDIEDPEFELAEYTLPVTKRVERELYLPDENVVKAVDLAIALGRPLLLQGEPGTGKTRLAHAVAYALRLPLEESYIKSTSRAQDLLYTYDAVNRLYDAQLGADGPRDGDGAPKSQRIRNYIRLGPLGRAIARAQYGRRSVVLIDEIDKADLDFPNDLLWELDRLEFRVAEEREMAYTARDRPEVRPIVFVTHNEEKPLPTAFLRRCIYHFVEFPKDEATLQKILEVQQAGDQALRSAAIDVVQQLRTLDLSKSPGLSELIDWVSYLEAAQTPAADVAKLPYSGVLLKQRADQDRAAEVFGKQ